MLRQFFKNLVLSRQASAAFEALNYLSDEQLKEMGYTRDNFVEATKQRVLAEFNANEEAQTKAPVNANLAGAV